MRRATGGLLLIALGVLFFLNNLGLIPWSFWWELLRYWPLALIFLGLYLLLQELPHGREIFWALLALFLMGLILGMLSQGIRAVRTQAHWTYPYHGEQEIRLDLEMGLGDLEVFALENAENLVEVNFRGAGTLHPRVRRTDGTTEITLKPRKTWGFRKTTCLVGISPLLPLRLETRLGIGETVLDLSALHLVRLKVDSGAGHTRVVLPRPLGTLRCDLDIGVGNVELFLPSRVPVRLDLDPGIGKVEVHIPGAFRQGNRFLTPDYEDAQDRLWIRLDSGIGKVRVAAVEQL